MELFQVFKIPNSLESTRNMVGINFICWGCTYGEFRVNVAALCAFCFIVLSSISEVPKETFSDLHFIFRLSLMKLCACNTSLGVLLF